MRIHAGTGAPGWSRAMDATRTPVRMTSALPSISTVTSRTGSGLGGGAVVGSASGSTFFGGSSGSMAKVRLSTPRSWPVVCKLVSPFCARSVSVQPVVSGWPPRSRTWAVQATSASIGLAT